MLALRPLGGSVVNFTEFWRTDVGKYGAGIDVKNNLKSSWTVSFVSTKSRTISSSEPIQDLAR
jgi:hypothetical protein